jgi:putative N-acetylmannosamine-6-phosphate epimerase
MGAMTEAARQGGANAVVVGPAITDPREITRALAAAIGDG